MKRMLMLVMLIGMVPCAAAAQDEPRPQDSPPAEQPPAEQPQDVPSSDAAAQPQSDADSSFQESAERATEKAKEIAGDAADKAADLAVKIDSNEAAKEAAAGILQPIYLAAEALSFPAFYWLAFALMAAGTVNFAFQLVLGKLVVLTKGSINLKEILSDSIGLIISVIGLVLTTQAATENSSFTQSAAMVLSATVAGALLGLFLYRWGQAQEIHAVAGKRAANAKK